MTAKSENNSVIYVILAVVIAGVAGAIWYFWDKNNKKDTNVSDTGFKANPNDAPISDTCTDNLKSAKLNNGCPSGFTMNDKQVCMMKVEKPTDYEVYVSKGMLYKKPKSGKPCYEIEGETCGSWDYAEKAFRISCIGNELLEIKDGIVYVKPIYPDGVTNGKRRDGAQ
jgi:hypothetical protein